MGSFEQAKKGIGKSYGKKKIKTFQAGWKRNAINIFGSTTFCVFITTESAIFLIEKTMPLVGFEPMTVELSENPLAIGLQTGSKRASQYGDQHRTPKTI